MCCQEIADPLVTASKNAFSTGGIRGVFQLLRQIEVVPADDAFFDKPFSRFRHFLFFFLRLKKLTWISHRDGACEAVRVLKQIEPLFDVQIDREFYLRLMSCRQLQGPRQQ
jgi:hypothetical protein